MKKLWILLNDHNCRITKNAYNLDKFFILCRQLDPAQICQTDSKIRESWCPQQMVSLSAAPPRSADKVSSVPKQQHRRAATFLHLQNREY